ncbi:elongation factor G-like protein EF-G2 [Protofrankia coriariae]|uniref:Elongation factor G n=1 Tax=Protofrankia coriariae TaxID=1562887 RepID=A0ABR5F4A2_9ACTN|nr:elongation factor G-like protein EF-G2 [Protofrankia coriariae]KLL11463.1 elongation factor G [Protofrankia coriariae]
MKTTACNDRPDLEHPADVRNVILVGHTGAGKTTLAESLLAAADEGEAAQGRPAPPRHTDHDDAEHRQRTINLTVLSTTHRGMRINLLDTPGLADFIGDLRAGLRGGDAALFVVSALDGVDGFTRLLWDECAAAGTPRAIVLTKLEHPRADFAATVATCQKLFGPGVLPLYLPVRLPAADGPAPGHGGYQLIDLLSAGGAVPGAVSAAGNGTTRPAVAAARSALIEGIIAESEDESLLEQYLAGEPLAPELLLRDLETAVARGRFHPVLPVLGPAGAVGGSGDMLGAAELLDLFTRAFPSPAEHRLPVSTRPDGSSGPSLSADPDGPLAAEVIRTTTDPYVGRISLVRVFSGTLRTDMTVHVCGHGRAERGHPDHDDDGRIAGISRPAGRSGQRPAQVVRAGDLCVVAKLATAETGDTLSSPDDPILLRAWSIPRPQLPVAIRARTKSSEDKLSTALARLAAEDPSLTVEYGTETGQLVLWCMGEAHSDVVIERLRARYGVDVDRVAPQVPLRETLRGPARGTGRHVKQSGGHGQYAICHVEVEPLPAGSGREFVDEVVGGAVPRQFIPSVEKGVLRQLDLGVAAGYPLVDIRVRLVDGKAHSVDSSDIAFQAAGALAVKNAARAAGIVLLEPVLAVCVLTPDEHVGPVTSDLAARRGRVVGIEPVGGGQSNGQAAHGSTAGRTLVRAEVPEKEMLRYAVDIRSLTQGTGTFTRDNLRYEPVPDHLAAEHLGDRPGETG